MPQTLTFADGNSAIVRDPETVPVKVRRVWEHAQGRLGSVAWEIKGREVDETKIQAEYAKAALDHPELVEAAQDAAVLALVQEWSYGEVSQTTLENLPGGSYDELVKTTSELAKRMSPNFQVQRDPKAEDSDGTPTTPESGV